MIVNNFYPTVTEYDVGTNYHIAATARIPSIPIDTTTFTNAYYLGWIRAENVPSDWFMSTFAVVGDRVVFNKVTVNDNYDIGITCVPTTSAQGATMYNSGYVYSETDGKWIVRSFSGYNMALPNALNVNQISTTCQRMCIRVVLELPEQNSVNSAYYNMANLSSEEWDNIIYNDKPFSITVSLSGYMIEREYKLSDFAEGIIIEENSFASTGVKYRLHTFITEIRIACVRDSRPTSAAAVGRYTNAQTYIKMYYNDGTQNIQYVISGNSSLISRSRGGGFTPYDNLVFNAGTLNVTPSINTNIFPGVWEGSIPLEQFTAAGQSIIIVGKCLILHLAGSVNEMYCPLSTDDVRKHFAINVRYRYQTLTNSIKYGVVTGFQYPEVLENGEWTGNIIRDATEENKESKLRPWQYNIDITVNDYKENDKPDYEPTSNDPEHVINGRVNYGTIPAALANGMTTFYLLSPGNLREFCNLLWGSVSGNTIDNPGGLLNFFVGVNDTLANTGSLDPASILNCVVSCRFYPFSLYGAIPAASTTGIKIGSGRYPYTLTNPPYTLSGSTVFTFSSGNLSFPAANSYKDIINTTVSIFMPYCGSVDVAAADVIGQTVNSFYAVDVATGDCACYLTVNGQQPLATGTGKIGFDVQLTATNVNAIRAFRNQTEWQAFTGVTQGLVNVADASNLSGMLQGATKSVGAGLDRYNTYLGSNGIAPSRIGSPQSLLACLEPQTIYAVIKRPNYIKPSTAARYMGNSTYYSGAIGTMSGYTVLSQPNLSGVNALDDEKTLLYNILTTGFYA